jgi:hypothetical protein
MTENGPSTVSARLTSCPGCGQIESVEQTSAWGLRPRSATTARATGGPPAAPQDQVHHLMTCLAGAQLPAPDFTLGIVLVLRPAVPRRELEYFQHLGIGVQGIDR